MYSSDQCISVSLKKVIKHGFMKCNNYTIAETNSLLIYDFRIIIHIHYIYIL
jgi:hypothetical protein